MVRRELKTSPAIDVLVDLRKIATKTLNGRSEST